MTVDQYLASIKARLLSDPVILSFHIVRERMTLTDAHLRVRLTLADASRLEFSEYAQRSGSGKDECRELEPAGKPREGTCAGYPSQRTG